MTVGGVVLLAGAAGGVVVCESEADDVPGETEGFTDAVESAIRNTGE